MLSSDFPVVLNCFVEAGFQASASGTTGNALNMNGSNLCFLNQHSKQNFVPKIGFTALKISILLEYFLELTGYLCYSPQLMRKFSWYLKHSWAAGAKAAVVEQRQARQVSMARPCLVVEMHTPTVLQ